MLPKYHLLYGFIFCLVLLILFPQITLFGAVIMLLSTVLIDVDHYLSYLFLQNDFSLRNAIKHFNNIRRKYGFTKMKSIKSPLMVLHAGETIILLALLSLNYLFFLYILIGFLFHIFLDFIDMYRLGVLNQRDYFIIQRIIRKNFLIDNYKYV